MPSREAIEQFSKGLLPLANESEQIEAIRPITPPAVLDEPRRDTVIADTDADTDANADADADEFQLSDREFATIQQVLSQLPLNIKIAIQDILADPTLPEERQKGLIRMLIRGVDGSAIARRAGAILGKQVVVPKGYRKKSGAYFEQSTRTLSYRFTQLRPTLLAATIFATIVSLLFFVSWRFVYRPIRASALYRQGVEMTRLGEYAVGNLLFDRAAEHWRTRRRYHQFAEAFIDEERYDLAAEKYEGLLAFFPYDKRGRLAYSRMEVDLRGDWRRAVEILRESINAEQYDYELLAALGDTYMDWAEEELDSAHYEHARVVYTDLLRQYGDRDASLMRMLHYFIRTDNLDEARYLKEIFHNDPDAEIDPFIYAELGGYLLDSEQPEDVEAILLRSLAADSSIPEPYYHLARHYRRIGDLAAEEQALNTGIALLKALDAPSRRQIAKQIDSHARAAEDRVAEGDTIAAQQYYNEGIRIYERALEGGRVMPSQLFGRLYAGLGDIYYYEAFDYDLALALYDRAEEHVYSDRGLDYRQGFIYYRQESYDRALNQFAEAAESYSNAKNILFAQANAFYHLRSYVTAEGYYTELLDRLNRERASINILRVEQVRSHRSLVEYLIKTHNNLGVTLVRFGESRGDGRQIARGLEHLTHSNELSVNYHRDPSTVARSEVYNLGQINSRSVLYDASGFETRVYSIIPRDLEELLF